MRSYKSRYITIGLVLLLLSSTGFASTDEPTEVVSNAFNYKSVLATNVSTRTGLLSLDFPVAQLPAETGLGFELKLQYQQYQHDDFYATTAVGWSVNLPYYDKSKNSLRLADGEVYQLKGSTPIYYRL